MEKLIVLGTGNAQALNYYNTCFALDFGEDVLLCDAGGGNGILKQLRDSRLPLNRIHHLIVTHAHSDHMTGVLWMVRMISTAMNGGKYEGEFHIYCHEALRDGLIALCRLSLQKKMHEHIGRDILFHLVQEGSQYDMCGRTVTFFDIRSTKMLQYGFTLPLGDGGKLCCLGDEPYNPACEPYVRNAQWLLCEAFCLYGERERFHPYEKNHSTVKEACELAQQLEVPNLVIWHTEDSHPDRKRLYTAEGKSYYRGRLFVPEDLEVIPLEKESPQPVPREFTRVIIAGGRHFRDYALLRSFCDRVLNDYTPTIQVVSGGAFGADALGERYAREHGYPVKRFPADWEKHGTAAGPIRNREMAENGDVLVAFWDLHSRGTASMIYEAQKKDLTIFVRKIPLEEG